MDKDYSDQCDEENKTLLEDLMTNAPSDDISAVIKGFNIDKSNTEILKYISTKFRKNSLVETGQYLNINTDGTAKDIARNIIQKINAMLLEKCLKCSNYYSVKITDTPTITCYSCDQGAHEECYKDLTKIMENYPGIELKFQCVSCARSESNNKLPDTSSKQSEEGANKLDSQIPGELHSLSINEEEKSSQTQADESMYFPPNKSNSQAFTQSPEAKGKNTQICKYFKIQRCKHGFSGENCKYSHPKLCNKILKYGNRSPYGCKLNADCSYFHPKMCWNSLKYNECLNKYCTFVHVKGTRYSSKKEENYVHDISQHYNLNRDRNQQSQETFQNNSQAHKNINTEYKINPTGPNQILQPVSQNNNNDSDHFLVIIKQIQKQMETFQQQQSHLFYNMQLLQNQNQMHSQPGGPNQTTHIPMNSTTHQPVNSVPYTQTQEIFVPTAPSYPLHLSQQAPHQTQM